MKPEAKEITEPVFIKTFDSWFTVDFFALVLLFKTIALKYYLSPYLDFWAAPCEHLACLTLTTALTQGLSPQRRKWVMKCRDGDLEVHLTVMVNFMCHLGCTMGSSDSATFLSVSVRVFPDEISI